LRLGPDTSVLLVKTKRGGVAAKAGHDLTLGVTSWSADVDLDGDPRVSLTADPHSMFVIEGSGGAFALGEEEYAAIEQTLQEEVLSPAPIEFRSSAISVNGSAVDVSGELTLEGERRDVAFRLELDDDRLRGSAIVKQSDWGIKPYSALFGTLKVADEVEILINAKLPRSTHDG
jgi:hypothetical protein